MTDEAVLPAPVEPVEGAVPVIFPWGPAAAALGALNAAKSLLTSQLDLRVGMRTAIEDWQGRFRDDYEAAHSRLTAVASGLSSTLASRASSIIAGAEEANAQQRTNNAMATHPGVTPV